MQTATAQAAPLVLHAQEIRRLLLALSVLVTVNAELAFLCRAVYALGVHLLEAIAWWEQHH
jgi:hypothetical protein